MLRTRWRKHWPVLRLVGGRQWFTYLRALTASHRSQQKRYFLRPKGWLHGVSLRAGTSDLEVFRRIFIDGEFAPVECLKHVELVVDCGANVGYSALYLLRCFPNCHVIAVEPDSANFRELQRNLEAYQDRTTLIRAGVWTSNEPLQMDQAHFRDGRHWARQVRPAADGSAQTVPGITINSILESARCKRISLLKIDIEGAEVEVLGGDLSWLDKVDAMTIELHDDSHFGNATEAFERATAGREFSIRRRADMQICIRQNRAVESI